MPQLPAETAPAALPARRASLPRPLPPFPEGTERQFKINSLSPDAEAGTCCHPSPPLPAGARRRGPSRGDRQRASRPFPSTPQRAPTAAPAAPHLVDVLPHPLPQPLQVHAPGWSVGAATGRRPRSPARRADHRAAQPSARRDALPCPAEPRSNPSPLPSLPRRNSGPSASFRERCGRRRRGEHTAQGGRAGMGRGCPR